MKKQDLDTRLSEYYTGKKLSDETLMRLMGLMDKDTAASTCPPVGFKQRCRELFGGFGFGPVPTLVTALSCLILVSFVTWHIVDQKSDFAGKLPMAVAREITMNHQKNLAPEFRDVAVVALGRTMAQLDFLPVSPDIVGVLRLKFIGARYCSIQGNIAAQLSYEAPDGSPYTLYQTRSVEALSGISASQIELDGLNVKLWHEKGLFMGMAGAGHIPSFQQ